MSEISEDLKDCELFALLNGEQMQTLTNSLADACNIEAYEAGDYIFEQGEYSAELHVIADGQVLLQRSLNIGGRTATWPLGLLGRGRAMGWSSLLYGPRYLTASALCQKPTRVISIDGGKLRAALEKQPDLGFRIMDRLACLLGERLRTAYNTMEAHL